MQGGLRADRGRQFLQAGQAVGQSEKHRIRLDGPFLAQQGQAQGCAVQVVQENLAVDQGLAPVNRRFQFADPSADLRAGRPAAALEKQGFHPRPRHRLVVVALGRHFQKAAEACEVAQGGQPADPQSQEIDTTLGRFARPRRARSRMVAELKAPGRRGSRRSTV
jgi:hypothetical protein